MVDFTPHTALLALHRIVDDGIAPVLGALGLGFATETILVVDAVEIAALADAGDPQASLLVLDRTPGDAPALLVAEPSLCASVLSAMWGSHRAAGAPLTPVESAMVHEFLADVCDAWRSSWTAAHVPCAPARTLTSSLALLEGQMVAGTWFVARTVVLDGSDEVGVLLFCYPAELVPALVEARRAISWRHRIEAGLDETGKAELAERIRRLGTISLAAPVAMQTELPLRVINDLERGDVISIDPATLDGNLRFRVLDRVVTGRIGRNGDNLVLAVVDGGTDRAQAAGFQPEGQMGDLQMPEYATGDNDLPTNDGFNF